MLSTQHPKMMAHQVLSANPLKRKHSVFQLSEMEGGSWLGSMADLCNGGFSQWKSVEADISSPQSNYFNQHQLPHGAGFLSNNSNMDASSSFCASVGQNPLLVMGAKAVATEFITSPEPISSVTACSEADLFSDGEYWDSVPVLSSPQLSSVDQKGIPDSSQVTSYECSAKHVVENEKPCYSSAFILEKIPERRFNSLSDVALPRHGDQHQVPPNAYMLEQVCGRVRERTNSLSNVAASTVVTRPEGSWQLLPNGNLLDKLSSGKHYGDSFHMNQIHVQKQCEIEQQEPFLLQHTEENNNSSNVGRAIRLYCYYKTAPVNKGRSQSGLLNILHNKLCMGNKCDCNMFQQCISHYENCRYNLCTLCKPAREFISSINYGLENPNSNVHNRGLNASGTSSMVDDTLPPTKRARTGHQANSSRVTSSDEHARSSEGTSDYKCSHEDSRDVAITHQDSISDEKKDVVMVHGDSMCDEKKDVVIEDLMLDEKKNVIRMEEMSFSETHIQAKEKKEIHYPEGPIQAMMTGQFLSPEGIGKAADTTEHIPVSNERVRRDNPFLSEAVDDRTASFQQVNSDTAVLEQQNIPQGPSDVQLLQEQPNVLSDPQDQQNVTQEPMDITFVSEPCQLESAEIINSTEARASFGDIGKFPVSHIDLFNPDQIKEHISSLRQSLGQPSSSTIMENPGENYCILCNMDKHYFGPAPLYCARCCNPIKHNSTYYWVQDDTASKHCFCTKCMKVSRGCTISTIQGHTFLKAQMLKEKNNIKDEESWVQCDNCVNWVHQICGLYNAKRDQEGKAKYTCPYCRLEEIKLGKHVPSPDSFGARDLPRTKLSDHIEQRLFTKLKTEREDRAKFLNKDVNEVPGVGELLVRVVSSVDKIVKVNQDFLNIIPDQDYPTEFPHKLKVILLFQKIEGIDVCLFCMYVQEYGSECGKPNQRSVYISYLDSIKYFRPDIRMVNGEALRTFVYHEILISYLDYCKSCGFAVCYIWACPPFKKEDYIFNCHPESQKIPKPDKLQQWYKSMLKKATKERVVVNYKTFYDAFIVQNEELSNKITVARLPYFDGDYWSDTAEITMRNLQKENNGESEAKKKPLTKRTMKAMGHEDANVDATNDILVMQKLGQAMLPSKENFLVVQLSYTCKKCQNLILSVDNNQCKDFSFCSRCLEMDPNLRERNMHTSTAGEEHLVSKVAINDLPADTDTDDKDIFLYNDIFENRHSFLGFCQGNNYQFNTIRRAKHSSMMILHDLSKQMRLIRKTACSTCHKDILIQSQWYRESGMMLQVGGTCCCNVSTHNHRYKFQNYFKAGCGVNKYEALAEKPEEVQVRKALEHASQCSNRCLQPGCIKVKKLFKHLRVCNAHLAGSCVACWRIWMLICIHTIRCKSTTCEVPRCRDVKEHFKLCSGANCRFCTNWRWHLACSRCN